MVLLLLLVTAAVAAGILMVELFRQSAAAQAGRAEAEIGRACDAITDAYRFYRAGWETATPRLDNEGLRRDLTAVVQTALRDRPGIEGLGPSGFRFTMVSDSPLAWQILGSDDLRTWDPLGDVTNTTGEVQFTDPAALGRAQRFYRAQLSR